VLKPLTSLTSAADVTSGRVDLVAGAASPWLTVSEAAERARCGPKLIYREVRSGRLVAARVGGRRELRLRTEWIDEWLLRTTTLLRAASPIASGRGPCRDY
jgi:excisionase family DNA binding protein